MYNIRSKTLIHNAYIIHGYIIMKYGINTIYTLLKNFSSKNIILNLV